MAAVLEPVAFDLALLGAELAALGRLLAGHPELSERDDILPLFRANRQLAAFLGTFDSDVGPATDLAHEFPFFGDYRADLVVGSRAAGHFCVVEFEDGKPDSIFKRHKRQPGRKNPEWSTRFEHGVSQLADWFFNLDDYKKTHGFVADFGDGHVAFTGLLVIGRSAGLDLMKRTRLRWRSDKVVIDSHRVQCLAFDELHDRLRRQYVRYVGAAPAAGPAG